MFYGLLPQWFSIREIFEHQIESILNFGSFNPPYETENKKSFRSESLSLFSEKNPQTTTILCPSGRCCLTFCNFLPFLKKNKSSTHCFLQCCPFLVITADLFHLKTDWGDWPFFVRVCQHRVSLVETKPWGLTVQPLQIPENIDMACSCRPTARICKKNGKKEQGILRLSLRVHQLSQIRAGQGPVPETPHTLKGTPKDLRRPEHVEKTPNNTKSSAGHQNSHVRVVSFLCALSKW